MKPLFYPYSLLPNNKYQFNLPSFELELKKALISCADRIKKYDKFLENKINMEVVNESKNPSNAVQASNDPSPSGGVSI